MSLMHMCSLSAAVHSHVSMICQDPICADLQQCNMKVTVIPVQCVADRCLASVSSTCKACSAWPTGASRLCHRRARRAVRGRPVPRVCVIAVQGVQRVADRCLRARRADRCLASVSSPCKACSTWPTAACVQITDNFSAVIKHGSVFLQPSE